MLKKDADGNDIPGSDDGQGQGEPKPELEKQLADLIAAQKKQSTDMDVMREENQRLQNLLISMREHPGDNSSNDSRRPASKGAGRFADPANRSEFERKYSLPAEAADEIIEEAVSRLSRAQQEREESIRNGETIKKNFFDTYPDLVGYEPIVRHFSDKCAREYPDWTVQKGFVEVSKNSRDYIKSKLGNSSGGDEPPPILSGGGHRSDNSKLPGSDDDKPTRTPTQEEEIKAEMAERSKNRLKAL